jgi:hypothetical protein
VSQDLSSLECRERGEGAGVESRVFEAETPVHTVGSEFECLLFDVVLNCAQVLLVLGFVRLVVPLPEVASQGLSSGPS